jgi:hypothetical protein
MLFIFFALFLLFVNQAFLIYKRNRIKDPGYIVVENILSQSEIENILVNWEMRNFKNIHDIFIGKGRGIKSKIKNILGDSYNLIDYMYVIENSAIHTYHRDYTSSKQYNNLEYPSYTMILYLDEPSLDGQGNGLNIIPKSHIDKAQFYIFDYSKKLNFKKGTSIIFDANILHAGTAINSNVNRKCIQFKIIHKDDISKLPHLQNFHVLINKPNDKNTILKYIEIEFTKHLPIISDLFQSTIKSAFAENKTFIQKFISKLVFSDSDFYKPKRLNITRYTKKELNLYKLFV